MSGNHKIRLGSLYSGKKVQDKSFSRRPPEYRDILDIRILTPDPVKMVDNSLPNGISELPGSPGYMSTTVNSTTSAETPVLAELLSFTSINERIDGLVRALEPVEERRARLLMAQLISVQSRINSWTRERDIVSIGEIESMLNTVPTITRDTMLDIFRRLKLWMESPGRPSLTGSQILSAESKIEYLELIVNGYDSLETLRTVYQGLENIVPFLSNRHQLDTSANNRSSVIERPDTSGSLAPKNLSSQGGSVHLSRNDIVDPQTQDQPRINQSSSTCQTALPTKSKPGIQLLYVNCLHALRAVTTQQNNKDSSNIIYSRMVVWGCGLFQISNSIDLILERDDTESTVLFRSHLIGVLADIAIILTIMLRTYDHSLDPNLHKSRTKLEACFGKFKELNEEAMEEGPVLPEPTEDGESQSFSQSCLTQLAGLVDCLFDVLPTIDRLRQIWVLDLEKRSRELAASLASINNSFTQETRRSLDIGHEAPDQYETRASISPIPKLYAPKEERSFDRNVAVQWDFSPAGHDELDFRTQPNDNNFSGKRSKPIITEQKSREDGPKRSAGAAVRPRRPRNKSFTDERQRALQDIVTMDLELATALRLSFLEAESQAAREKQKDKEIMTQLKEWDEEIERLESWSSLFENSIRSGSSEAETIRIYSVFEQLAKIGQAFAGAGTKNRITTTPLANFEAKDAIEGKLRLAASVISKATGKSIDVKIDPAQKSPREMLLAFREANNNIQKIG